MGHDLKQTILILPGYANSGQDHWQTLWEQRRSHSARVQQRDWLEPKLDDWLDSLQNAIIRSSDPVILVAHSLGCILAAQYCTKYSTSKIRAALLVAPPDLDSGTHQVSILRNFGPVPRRRLPHRTIVVSSSDDPFASLAYTRTLAEDWGATFVNLGAAGHINAESGHGPWPKGEAILDDLLGTCTITAGRQPL